MPSCSQPNCRIAQTGVCLNGHKQGCPYKIGDLPDSKPLPATDETPAPKSQHFHTGEKLTLSEASRLLNDRPARLVLCAGAKDSGKTTFFARLGEMFCDGSFARYGFAASLTLCAFARASWLATINSGVARPMTKRTLRSENDTFLHLCIHAADDPKCKFELLLSDLAGETFPTAVASREFCAGLHALARADHLVVFLDCAQLADSAKRHSECDNVRAFLQRVIAVKHQPRDLRVQVVFSRWDYITRQPERAVHEKFCETIRSDFAKRFDASFGEVGFWNIAARPDQGTPTNTEIQSLFAHWLETPLSTPNPPAPRNRRPVRDFSAFGLK